MKRIPILLIGLVLAASVIFAGCTSGSGTTPAVAITSPQDKGTVPAGNVTLNIRISNFAVASGEMSMMGKKENKAGEGHIHWFIDVPVPTEPGKKAETAKGTWSMHDETSITWPNVKPGTHTFSAELVNNDMTPLSPPVYQTITLTVK